ncbi:fumarylacetoacetate hydrolase family protein [Pseudomonas eucalypticola]|uniref:Fumarylacetoacetate hydrolase family protein n=1 Tax=Pseudomonas eucalypticola TaxID=2599595 RepID=A0A7D5HNP8_9PSED|nr:fumarylacetoacetate hydrolase family protein [Pseudomonas eucalypticola]QKZ04668.1 fumarylacetoacetate hydrolase family protein [Pseudomonas eucalypticola]
MSPYVFAPAQSVTLDVQGSDARFPVYRLFCLGRNYPWGDAQDAVRQAPLFFMKPASAVVPAEGELAYPPLTGDFCHEIELVVAIGADGADIPQEQALAHVWGYAAGLDLTRRDLQMAAKAAGQPWEAAKAFDGSAPISAVVPASRIGHPDTGAVWLRVNGVERQRSSLEQQIWSVSEIISRLSQSIRLRAGDLIMTGTPPGVAALQPGDVISAGIDGVGQLDVRVGARPALNSI